MQGRFTTQQDPADWCGVIAVFFLALAWWRLGIPSDIYFDEVHYVNAARKLIEGVRANPEHPLLAKEVIAASIRWLGDKPLYWRLPSAFAGTIGLFAFSRLVWFTSGRRLATILATLLLATNFMWFVQSRIAMLDMVMAGLGMVGLWQFAAAMRKPGQGHWRLALAGTALGLAVAAKWSIVPAAMLPGLLFLAVRLRMHGPNFVTATSGGPVPGVSLLEAGLWLGALPMLVYWLTYWPAFFYAKQAIDPFDPIGWHQYMLRLQDSVMKPHPYRSVWYQWIGNIRAIWYLYRETDGAWRGIVMVGNPLTMLAGLPALAWGLWAGIRRGRGDALAFAALYAASLGMWAVSGKPVQFYYHYLLPGAFLMALLALALDELWQRKDRWRWLPRGLLAANIAVFVWFYPIISAAPLHNGKASFEQWMWLASWR
ncbi:phospholipid carrier-dependent glycosyltransferase [Novosphingobium sp.]|uniref:phospholipid carrier-dependent glycosyltransferase n=1 Tax=Novosphingobium sp. TaxID=1874826 RepID=UPI0035B2E88E